MDNKKWEKARVACILFCPVDAFLSWFAVTHFNDPFNEIAIFLIAFIYIAAIIFVEAKAGTQALRRIREQ